MVGVQLYILKREREKYCTLVLNHTFKYNFDHIRKHMFAVSAFTLHAVIFADYLRFHRDLSTNYSQLPTPDSVSADNCEVVL